MESKIPKHIIKEYNKTRNFFWRRKVCFAPFNSLRFSLSGNMYSCCYNRYHSLGRYPEVSIHDAWNGIKAQELRNNITNNNFDLGCHACYTKLINNNYYSVGARIYDNYNFRKEGPSLMEFELSNVCNLECVMCNGENSSLIRKNREKGEPYPMIYDEAFVEQLKEFIPYLDEARFVGGEPFLSELYFKIWDEIIRINPKTKINILTNGTILNDRILNLYKNHNIHISFSIDSIVKETYQKIRINADYEKVMNHITLINALSKYHHREISINICPIRKNMFEIPEMTEYFSKMNIPVIFHTVVYPPQESLSTLTKEELKEYVSFLENSNFFKSYSQKYINYCSFKSFISLVKMWENEKTHDINDNLSFDELWILLTQHIVDSKTTQNIYLQKNIEDLKSIFNEISDIKIKTKAAAALLKIKSDYIIAELQNTTHEKLKNRILAMGT